MATQTLDELLSGNMAEQRSGNATSENPPAEEEENLDDVEETVVERLVGLTEMVPERVWNAGERGFWFSVWLVRRTAWVLGTSLALLALPPFIEQQRLEYEEMQNMQKKQLMLGQGAPPTAFPPASPR